MSKTISNKEFLEFNRVFSLLLISHLSIDAALSLITKQTKNDNFKTILKEINSGLKSGKQLSTCFAKYPKIFNDIYIANIKVAEETGNLSEVLSEYTEYQEKFFALRKKILQAARYPLFTLIVAFAVVSFMLLFLIPTFESLFASMKTTVPPLTAFLMTISNYTTENSLFIFIFITVIFFVLKSAKDSQTIKRSIIDKLLIRIPLISSLFKQNLVARFSLSMSILLKSNVTLLEALKISQKTSDNSIFQQEIKKMVQKLSRGESLSDNVRKSFFFDVTFTKLLAAGEESAEMDKVFSLISNYYSKEFDYRLETITSLIEPILILFIGGIVSVILIAMYMPMFEIINYLGV